MAKSITSGQFIQEGIGFKDLADVGIILESKPILDKILELDYDFQVISSYHLDYDWYLLNMQGVRIALEPKSPAIADIEFTQRLSNALRQRNNVVHNGIVWSTDGRWKETDTAIARRISDGAIGTDMESSALFAFGIDRKTSVVSISVLSDEIHNSEGDYKGLSDKDIWFGKVLPKMTEAFETIIKVVTE